MPTSPEPRRLWSRLAGASGRMTYAIDVALLLGLFAAWCGPYLVPILTSPIPGGWDGVPHYGVADLYAREIFPAIDGWMPEYLAGMPFPTFYPPVFYFVVAALTWLGLSTAAAFLTVQTAAMVGVSLLTYLCGRRLSGARTGGLVAGALATGYLMDRTPLTRFGIAVEGTFETGLSTQLLGHVCFLVFCYGMLGAHRSRRSAALAGLFFGLVALTNINTIWAAAVLFVCFAVVHVAGAATSRDRWRLLVLHVAIGLAGVLVSACWVLPMLGHLDYVPTLATESMPPGAVLYSFLRLGGYLLLALVAAILIRDRQALALVACAVVLVIIAVFPFREYPILRDLPLQPGRHAVVFPFVMSVLVGQLVVIASGWLYRPLGRFRQPLAQPLLGIACVAAFFVHFKPSFTPATVVSESDMANYRQVLEAMGGRTDGRVMAQVGEHGFSDGFAMQSLLGAAGAHSLTTVFRESALNVLLAVPFRNSMAGQGEGFGIDAKLDAEELAAGSLEQQLARLRLFNIKYFVVQTAEMKRRIAALPGLVRESPPGRWELYRIDAPGFAGAVVPAFAPVLTFAEFTVKRRPEVGFDFMRLGEEMFAAARLDVPLVLSRAGQLDRETDWDRFQTALITQYAYDDRQRAYAAIERFTRDRHLIVLASDDPLDAKIARLAEERPTIHRIARPQTAEQGEAREVFARLFALLEQVAVPLEGVPAVTGAHFERDRARIELDGEPAAPVPVWIRHAYFPSWENPTGEPIYMATPAFKLTFVDQQSVVLRYRSSWLHTAGLVLSGLGCILVMGMAKGMGRRQRAVGSAVST